MTNNNNNNNNHKQNNNLIQGFGTRAIHAGQDPDPATGAVIPPISLSTTFTQPSANAHQGYEYTRAANPNRNAFETAIASLEGAEYASAFSSGTAVITAILSILPAGSHLIASDAIYGGTYEAFSKIAIKQGIETTIIDLREPSHLTKLLKPNTKLVWIETPSNPTLRIDDIQAIAKYTHEQDAFLVVDNTFMTPYFQNPLQLGADIVMHSVTKFINGHTDVLMGVAATNRIDLHQELQYIQNFMGGVPSPFECYLARRGLMTLEVRMQRHEQNAFRLADYLLQHPQVTQVHYPGLNSHPQHTLAAKQQKGFGGMLSFTIKGNLNNVNALFQHLSLVKVATSLGGVESLVSSPAYTSHARLSQSLRDTLGITETLIRVSVGIESIEDLLADFKHALENAY
ncbi:Cys/Met metabolism PLP-dependent enzyme-domain-containing protein [Phascolomyces articulosus]|uniref:cystathionine gamma-lyase n=1 Tax=Phascolomyces articulosus TaxID=60185 RepID=A0AAD5K4G2_9FUNG|nr:Cys/Met metabolism PLP-dependent enzyme-domain-containing protein [Phascolomyces articulosus]